MKHFKIDDEFFDLFPDAQIYVLTLKNFDNHVFSDDEESLKQLLKTASEKAKKHVPLSPLSKNEPIAIWREAFKEFKTKKGARCSIEALLKRISKGHVFTPILPLVDIYNSISLEFGVPAGAEDIEKIAGDIHLGLATGGEDFKPLGRDKNDPALPGEVCYYDKVGAVCRNFNWREAERTMIDKDTDHAILFIETVYPSQYEVSEQAAKALSDRLQSYFNVKPTLNILDKESPDLLIQ